MMFLSIRTKNLNFRFSWANFQILENNKKPLAI